MNVLQAKTRSFMANISRSIRWRIVRLLVPSSWERLQKTGFPPIEDIPRGSTLEAMGYFKDKSIIFCEVGVEMGLNCLSIFESLSVAHAYLIDAYEEYTTAYTGEPYLISQEKQNKACETAIKNLHPFRDRTTWIRKYSDKAVEDIPDDIDFIYIDCNHTYEYVKKDIEIYWEKVAIGGLLAGHDLFGTYNGVIRAVHEFAIKKELPIYSNLYDWWFIKTALT